MHVERRYLEIIDQTMPYKKHQIEAVLKMLEEGNTVPFIARYRKELTEWATDEQLRDFDEMYRYTRNLESRKLDVIRLIEEKWLMTEELKAQIMQADTLARGEDLYRPFKEKKKRQVLRRWPSPRVHPIFVRVVPTAVCFTH